MFYDFPVGITIEEVREAVASINAELGVNAFIEIDKGDVIVFNYLLSIPGAFVFPLKGSVDYRRNSILRELRGLKFYAPTEENIKAGLVGIAARPLSKFFNLNQNTENLAENIDWKQPHKIYMKLDGSFVHPLLRHDGRIVWSTKMEVGEAAFLANEFVKKNPHYEAYARKRIARGETAIFEWTSPSQRIVIVYPEDQLTLLAVRNNITGQYIDLNVSVLEQEYNIPVVRSLDDTVKDVAAFVKKTQDLIGEEGYVISFDHGGKIKIKAEAYVQLHRAQDDLANEKNVLAIILDDTVDDVKALLGEEDRRALDTFQEQFEKNVAHHAKTFADEAWAKYGEVDANRKRFFVEYAGQLHDQYKRNVVLSVVNGQDATKAIKDIVRKHLGSGPRIDLIRHLFSGATSLNWKTIYKIPVSDGD